MPVKDEVKELKGKYELIATATFGLEAVVRREIENLGYEVLRTEDGKITYGGDASAIVRSNIRLRVADRVLLKAGEFTAETFEELFDKTYEIPWEELIPEDGRFVITGTSVKSKLHSVPACQSIVKKAVARRLGEAYGLDELPETGGDYTIKITLLKDRCTLTVDTSGHGLHKRGYRERAGEAPIKETLAAALVELSFWNRDRILVDPLCGSGTILIEAAMMGRNIAPGLSGHFASEGWNIIGKDIWKKERQSAYEDIDYDNPLFIYGSDIDEHMIEIAGANAEAAGVAEDIKFSVCDVADLKLKTKNEVFITNPPYGERIGNFRELNGIYKALRRILTEDRSRSLFLITPDKTAEGKIAKPPNGKANRRRKLYNGRIETCYYQFHGEKPDRVIQGTE